MASPPDLKIVEEDVKRVYEALDVIAFEFANDASIAADIGAALGHQKLAERFAEFSESWRVNRERMTKAFESLSSELRQKLDAFTEIDNRLGHPQPHPDPDHPDPERGPKPTPEPFTGDGGSGGGGGGGSSTQGSGPRPPLPTDTSSAASTSPAGSSPSPTGGGDSASLDPHPSDPKHLATGGSGADVTVDTDDGGFHASTTFVAGGSAAAAAVMGLYGAWLRSRSPGGVAGGAPGGGAAPAPDAELDARTRLLQEFERQRLGDGGGTIDLVADPKDPSDVLAILRGEDGLVSELHFSDLDGSDSAGDAPAGIEGDAGSSGADGLTSVAEAAADLASGQAMPADDPAGRPDLGSAGASAEAAAAGGPTGPTGGGSFARPDLVEPTSSGDGGAGAGVSGGHHGGLDTPLAGAPATGTHVSAMGLPDFQSGSVTTDLGDQRHDANATAGMGMMGMGMASAATSAAAGGRHRGPEEERPPLDTRIRPTEAAKEEER